MENSIFTSNNNIADLLIDHTNLLGIPYTRRYIYIYIYIFLFKLYPVHKAINNNQAQQRFDKWKTTPVSNCMHRKFTGRTNYNSLLAKHFYN